MTIVIFCMIILVLLIFKLRNLIAVILIYYILGDALMDVPNNWIPIEPDNVSYVGIFIMK